MACAKMFELIHGSLTGGEEEGEVSFQHPNQYFEESYKRLHKNLGKLFYLHRNLGKQFFILVSFSDVGRGKREEK